MNGAQKPSTFEGFSKFQVLKTNLANWKALKFIPYIGWEKLNKINKLKQCIRCYFEIM